MGVDHFKAVQDFVLLLTHDGVPPEVAMRIEAFTLEALVRAGKDQRAAEREKQAADLLPRIGASGVAAREGCCRKTVYNRALRHARKCKSG